MQATEAENLFGVLELLIMPLKEGFNNACVCLKNFGHAFLLHFGRSYS